MGRRGGSEVYDFPLAPLVGDKLYGVVGKLKRKEGSRSHYLQLGFTVGSLSRE
jgi:hypothetical protein